MSQQLGANGADIAPLARTAFVDSMSGALWLATAAAVLATVLAVVYLPRHLPRRASRGHGTEPAEPSADHSSEPELVSVHGRRSPDALTP